MAEKKTSAETTVKNIRRRTRRKYSAEEKIRIVIEGLRGENTVAELCRREGINQNLYYKWSKEFLEAGKQRLAGDTKRQASSNEVKELRRDMEQLKQLYRVRTCETVLGLELRDAFPSKQGSSGGFHDDEGSICRSNCSQHPPQDTKEIHR
jgi:transposase